MANPQTEDGFTKIANEIMDALCRYRIPGEERQALDFILRKTYGWNKRTDAISLSQFCEGTGMKKPNVVRALSSLEGKNIILIIKNDNGAVIKKDNAKSHVYEFNKNFESWRPLSKKITLSKKIKPVIKSDNVSLSKAIPTKDTITKDTHTKESIMVVNHEEHDSHPSTKPKKRPSDDSKKIQLNIETWEWEGITETDLERWGKAYPSCDIKVELARASEYIRSHPEKMKKNWLRYLVGWFGRSQQWGGTKGSEQPKSKSKWFSQLEGEDKECNNDNLRH